MFQACDLKHRTEIKIPRFQCVLESSFQCNSDISGHGYMIRYGPLPILNSCTPRMAAVQSYYSGAEHITKCPMDALWSKIYIIMLTQHIMPKKKKKRGDIFKKLFLKYLRSCLSEKRFPAFDFVRLSLCDIYSCMSSFMNLEKDYLNLH